MLLIRFSTVQGRAESHWAITGHCATCLVRSGRVVVVQVPASDRPIIAACCASTCQAGQCLSGCMARKDAGEPSTRPSLPHAIFQASQSVLCCCCIQFNRRWLAKPGVIMVDLMATSPRKDYHLGHQSCAGDLGISLATHAMQHTESHQADDLFGSTQLQMA